MQPSMEKDDLSQRKSERTAIDVKEEQVGEVGWEKRFEMNFRSRE